MLRLLSLISFLLFLPPGVMAGQITVKGSDTMVRLCQRLAEEYMKSHKQAVIQVSGGGSSSGIAALINGSTRVCASSRLLTDAETRVAATKGVKVNQLVVALDGIAIYLHKSNPIVDLTLSQLREIYTDRIANWKDLGGPDQPIILYGRENNSGTYTYFQKEILGGEDFAERCEPLPGTAAVVNAVAHDINGIGYGGIAWATTIKYAGIKANDSTLAVLPNAATVSDRSYPISRELYFFLNGEPAGETKEFLDWVFSSVGEKVVVESGFVAVRIK
jgi:phosphate transport system substrate-binding protein